MSEWYNDQRRDPRWQRVKTAIQMRDNFRCSIPTCQRSDKTLEVHHTYYIRGRKCWEYPLESLHLLCRDCHDRVEQGKIRLAVLMFQLTPDEFDGFLDQLERRIATEGPSPLTLINHLIRNNDAYDAMAQLFSDWQAKLIAEMPLIKVKQLQQIIDNADNPIPTPLGDILGGAA